MGSWIDVLFVTSSFPHSAPGLQVFLLLANDLPIEDLLAVLHILCQVQLQTDFILPVKCLLNKIDNVSILMKLPF